MPTESPTRVRFTVMFALALAAAIAYLGRNALVVSEKTIRHDLGLSEEQMGLLLGPLFFWPYALLSIPAGWLCQRLGSRFALPMFMLMSAVGTGLMAAAGWPLFAFIGSFAILAIGRVISGVAQSGLFPGCVQTFTRWHPASERGIATGSLAAAMSIGGAACVILSGWLLDIIGWKLLIALIALPGLVWLVLFGFWFRNTPESHPSVNQAELKLIQPSIDASPEPDRPVDQYRLALALALSPALWFICGQQFFRGAGYAFFASWFATFLQETRGVSTAGSGYLTALPLLATVLAAFAGGGFTDWIYRRTGSLTHARKTTATVSLLACSLLVLSAFWVTQPLLAVLLISLGAFCAGFAGPSSYSVTIDLGGKSAAVVFAAMNMLGNIGAGLLPFFIPYFRSWLNRQENWAWVWQDNSWNAVLILFALIYFLAALCWQFISLRSSILDQSLLPLSNEPQADR